MTHKEKACIGNCSSCSLCEMKDRLQRVDERNSKGEIWLTTWEKVGIDYICKKDGKETNINHVFTHLPLPTSMECFKPWDYQVSLAETLDLSEEFLAHLKEKKGEK